MTSSLAEIQAVFGRGLNPFSTSEEQAEATFLIRDKGPMSSLEKLQVYQRNISGAHIAVLEQIFPVCREILGENPFATYARHYCWDYPEADPDLNQYGISFAEFLSNQIKLTDIVPYLSDLARLEYQWHQAWFSSDADAFDCAKLAKYQEQPHRITFQCPDHLSLLESLWPIHHLWDEHRNGTPPAELRLNAEPDRLLIIRRDTVVDVKDISEEAFSLLTAIQCGKTLAELSETPTLVDSLSLLPKFIENQWICGLELVPENGSRS